MTKKLLVIIPDKISALLQKGEVTECYYNPGNLFEEVHILMTNEDQPDPRHMQKMVGTAKLYLHNLPQPNHFFRNTFGWQLPLIKSWALKGLSLAKDINPSLIRTHNNFLEGYLASFIKHRLAIPYVVSLHGVWDVDDLKHWKNKLHRIFRKKLEIIALKNADAVLCVYSSIIDYAKRHGAINPILLHNFIGKNNIKVKKNWDLSTPPIIITVNRQLPEKNPINIIKALSLLPFKVRYILIGDGILHEDLKALAQTLHLEDSIEFKKSLSNEQVCQLYQGADMLVSNCYYKGISKTVIESGLTGLPIIINHYEDGYKLPEYQGEWLEECDDTPQGYAESIKKLIENEIYRKALGKKALAYTSENFDPATLENRVVDIYKNLMKKT